MGIRKSLGLLVEHVVRYGPIRGIHIVVLKSLRFKDLATISSDISGGPIQVRPGTSDMAIYQEIFLDPYLPRNRSYETVVDCGANIGSTVLYLKAFCPNAKVIAIEPDRENFEILSKNTARLTDVHCVMAGVWPEHTTLDLEREGLGHSGLRTVSSDAGDTLAVTIQEIMSTYHLDRISLLKVDIEGSELELFSATDLSWIEKVDSIAIELHDHWKPGCGEAFFKAIAPYRWTYSLIGYTILCERWEGPADHE